MTQEQAVIALRDAADKGGEWVIDTDTERIVGILKRDTRVTLTSRGINFRICVKPRTVRYERQIVHARVLAVTKRIAPGVAR